MRLAYNVVVSVIAPVTHCVALPYSGKRCANIRGGRVFPYIQGEDRWVSLISTSWACNGTPPFRK